MFYNAWPTVLFVLRRRAGRSQTEAAAHAGVVRSTWARWERGLIVPAYESFGAIARGVALSEAELGYEYSGFLYRHYGKQVGVATSGNAAATSPTPASRCRSRPPTHRRGGFASASENHG